MLISSVTVFDEPIELYAKKDDKENFNLIDLSKKKFVEKKDFEFR